MPLNLSDLHNTTCLFCGKGIRYEQHHDNLPNPRSCAHCFFSWLAVLKHVGQPATQDGMITLAVRFSSIMRQDGDHTALLKEKGLLPNE